MGMLPGGALPESPGAGRARQARVKPISALPIGPTGARARGVGLSQEQQAAHPSLGIPYF